MNRVRALLAVAGVGTLAAAPRLESWLDGPVSTVVDGLGNDYLLVGALAVLALAVGLLALASGRTANLEQAALPEPESPLDAPVPGYGFDEELDDWWLALPIVGARRRAAIRTRLREATIRTLMRTRGYERNRATALVDDGSWTGDDRVTVVVRPSARLRPEFGFRAFGVGGAHWFARRVRRTVDAIDTLSAPVERQGASENRAGSSDHRSSNRGTASPGRPQASGERAWREGDERVQGDGNVGGRHEGNEGGRHEDDATGRVRPSRGGWS